MVPDGPTSWCSWPCVIPSPWVWAGLTDSFAMGMAQQKWWNLTSGIRWWKDQASLSWVLFLTCWDPLCLFFYWNPAISKEVWVLLKEGGCAEEGPGGWEATWGNSGNPGDNQHQLPARCGRHLGRGPCTPVKPSDDTTSVGSLIATLGETLSHPVWYLFWWPWKRIWGLKCLIPRVYCLLTPILFQKYLRIFWCHSNFLKRLL